MGNIKNYTSTIPASRSMAKIEELLVEVGAKNINKEYVDQRVTAFYFLVDVNDKSQLFKLPVKTEAVEKILIAQYKKPTKESYKNAKAQSERTAWKIICDWVEIQCTMIKLEQAELAQVFLPYCYNHKSNKTLWEEVKGDDFKMLGG